jgi:adenylyl-sulfate kinase
VSGLVVWFVGLSGSGKSTIAEAVSNSLASAGLSVEMVDGDRLRQDQAPHLGYSSDDIIESNKLAIQFCSELRQHCDIVLVPRISPHSSARQVARQELGSGFIEVYVKASLETVQERDPKNLYERARNGQGDPMIGMPGATPFEAPEHPDLVLDTESFDHRALAAKLEKLISEWSIQAEQTTERRI